MLSVVAAEVAGYRPSLRCRPDHLPVVPIEEWNDPFITAALDLINEGFLDDHGEIDLAMSLGHRPATIDPVCHVRGPKPRGSRRPVAGVQNDGNSSQA